MTGQPVLSDGRAPAAPARWAGGLGPGAPVAAFDVGGTDIKCCLVDGNGTLVEMTRVPAPPPGPDAADAVLDVAAAMVAAFRARRPELDVATVGLAVPGTVDEASGVGVWSKNLRWAMFPFRERAEAVLGLPVAFGHDVRAAGTAEFRLGAAAPFRDVLVVTVGTGIAAAVFVDGVLHGAGGYAGELGHARVADGPDCGCGGRGCLEAVASAASIARRYSVETGRPAAGAKGVLEAAAAGDPVAERVWRSAIEALALGLSHASLLLAPEAIVVGGGLAQAGAALFDPLSRALDELVSFHRPPALLPAAIGEDAGVIGAALLARDLSADVRRGALHR